MTVAKMFYVGNEGLKIIPYPEGAEETIEYKFYMKRHWWQFWKPKWIYLTAPLTKGK